MRKEAYNTQKYNSPYFILTCPNYRYEASLQSRGVNGGGRRRFTPPAASAGGGNFWQQQQQKRPSLQEQHSSVWNRMQQLQQLQQQQQPQDDGRESVVTVLTNSSSETVRFHDGHQLQQQLNGSAVYQNLDLSAAAAAATAVASTAVSSHHQSGLPSAAYDYASLPPEPRGHQATVLDLKKFPLQTYPSQSMSKLNGDQDGSVCQQPNSTLNGSVRRSSRPRMRHQMSEKALSNDANKSSIHHSKSVPNLKEEEPASPEDQQQSFSYLDPEKRLRVTDNTLKLIQKQALLDYYERHSSTSSNGTMLRRHSAFQRPVTAANWAGNKPEMDSGFYSPTEKPLQQQQQQQQTPATQQSLNNSAVTKMGSAKDPSKAEEDSSSSFEASVTVHRQDQEEEEEDYEIGSGGGGASKSPEKEQQRRRRREDLGSSKIVAAGISISGGGSNDEDQIEVGSREMPFFSFFLLIFFYGKRYVS